MTVKTDRSRYRWYILALTMASYGLLPGAARLAMPVLFKEISDDLGLSLVQVGAIWGADPLAGIFIGLPGGLLADRFGVKRTMTVICILAGIFGAVRGFSVDFITMIVTMFLFGLMVAATPSIVPKVTALWFGSRQLGLANALLNVGWSVGAMGATMLSATVLSPWLGGWRGVMFFFGAPGIIMGLLWLITGREPDKLETPNVTPTAVPFRQALSKVARLKTIWIIGLMTLAMWGANMGVIGYLPIYLRDIGWTPAAADGAITALNGVSSLGIIPMVLLSDRLISRRGVIALSIAVQALCFAALPFASTLGVWAIIIVGTFIRSGGPTLLHVITFEMKEVGATYGGTAIGLTSTIAMVGAFLSPPFGNSLADISPGTPFLFWAGLAALGLPLLYLIKQTR